MLGMLIATFCFMSYDFGLCQDRIRDCIEIENSLRYQESMWLDVPTEKGSIRSMGVCVDIKGLDYFMIR